MTATTLAGADSAHAASAHVSTPARTVGLLAAGSAVAVAANAAVAAAAVAAGAGDYIPLGIATFGSLTVLGLVAGWVGWRTIARRATSPARVLRVLVPVLAVLSFIPDAVLGLTTFIPGTTLTGVVALMLMHLVVLAVALPVYARITPVRA